MITDRHLLKSANLIVKKIKLCLQMSEMTILQSTLDYTHDVYLVLCSYEYKKIIILYTTRSFCNSNNKLYIIWR